LHLQRFKDKSFLKGFYDEMCWQLAEGLANSTGISTVSTKNQIKIVTYFNCINEEKQNLCNKIVRENFLHKFHVPLILVSH